MKMLTEKMKCIVFICVSIGYVACVDLNSYSYLVPRCLNDTIGYYPKCECADNYGYNNFEQKCRLKCPSISVGEYPLCSCIHSERYDYVTNSCLNPNCPPNTTADSIHPNCKCTEKNHEYNEHLNDCYLSCPNDSSGLFPDCVCDDRMQGFNKELFECMKCPKESTKDSIYPNCITETMLNSTYNALFNEFRTCHPGSYGKYPDCICENGNVYVAENTLNSKAGCLKCPYNGSYPNCTCPTGLVFHGGSCQSCPEHGVYPNCSCYGRKVYDIDKGLCLNCPANGHGIYPQCKCDYPFFYKKNSNQCVSCPKDAFGIYPECSCVYQHFGFDRDQIKCIKCPSNSKGQYPNCECRSSDHIYERMSNRCDVPCENGQDIYPNCDCGNKLRYYFDIKSRKCRSYANSDRACPPTAIGQSPNCHCVQYGHFFIPYGWGCFNNENVYIYLNGMLTQICAGPLCDRFTYEIDPRLLHSLVG